MATKSLVKAENGYGITGVNVFFSIADIYRLKEMVANIETTCIAGEVAVKGLANLHDRLVKAINISECSLFDTQTEEDSAL